jgi:hypothetical protein
MNPTLEDRIRERAYFLWLESGSAGDDIYYWLIAEREVMADVATQAATVPQIEDVSEKLNAARRVNALVQIDLGADREQAA